MGPFGRYVAERVIIFIATVAISVTVVFFAPRLVPGDPLGAINIKLAQMGSNRGADALIAEYRVRFLLDKSPLEQYAAYVGQLARGNLGYSIAIFPSTVGDLLANALPWTIGLMLVTTVLSWTIGSIIGGLAGWTGNRSRALKIIGPVALVLYTIPYYILAIVLSFVVATLLPHSERTGAFTLGTQPSLSVDFAWDVISHAWLPALSIVLVSLGWWFLSMRSLVVSIKGEDFMTWAEAKGLPPRRIFWGYAFRNALLPQTTGLALSLGHIFGGQLVTETIFGYPGLGNLIFTSIKTLDFPVIQGSILLIIVSVATINFILDLVYPLIDPRIRYGAAARN